MSVRPTVVLAIVAVLVVALAVVAAVVSGGRERPTPDASTPEGVVQLYASTLFDGNVAAAVEHLDPALGCTDPLPEVYLPDTARIAVVESTSDGTTARVGLRIEEGSGINGGWSHREDFTLRRESGTWLITGTPWPIYECQ